MQEAFLIKGKCHSKAHSHAVIWQLSVELLTGSFNSALA